MADNTQFERMILRGLLKGYDTRRLMSQLTVSHFETIQLRHIFEVMLSYYRRFHEIPSAEILTNELGQTSLPKEELQNISAFINKAEDVQEDKFKYAVEFVQKEHLSRTLRNAMKEAIAHLDRSDPQRAQDVLLKEATQLATFGRDIKVVDFVADFNGRKEALIRRRDSPELFREFYIPTGIPKLDAELDGGLRKGELGLFLAPPESGKSISLQDVAMSAVLNGFKVALVTIEMTPEQTAYRLDSRLTQMRYRKFRRTDLTDEEIAVWESEVKKLKDNCFKIVGVPEGCSCRLIESEILKMSTLFVPDLIAVDYAGIMSPNEGKFESTMDWKYIGAVVRNLKGLALKLNIPIWSASQLLVGAKEKAEVKMTDIGLARQQIAAHADVCVAIVQTNQMKAMDVTKLQFIKIREGCENRAIEIISDYDRISLEQKTPKEIDNAVGASEAFSDS